MVSSRKRSSSPGSSSSLDSAGTGLAAPGGGSGSAAGAAMYRPPASTAKIARPPSILAKIREDGRWTGVVGLAVKLFDLVGIIGLHPFRSLSRQPRKESAVRHRPSVGEPGGDGAGERLTQSKMRR